MKQLSFVLCLLAMCWLAPQLQAQDDEVLRVAQVMPEFPGCEEMEADSKRLRCSRAKLMAYIDEHLEYPAEAMANRIEGAAVVAFIVNKDGSLSDIEILRDIGDGCGEAAKAVIQKMQDEGLRWHPGSQGNRPVRVLFNLPVRFKLPKEMAASQEIEEYVEIEEDVVMEIDEPRVAQRVSPPPPPPPSEEIFRVVEDMPRFFSADCEIMNDRQQKKECAQEAMLELIYTNLKYPKIALENGVEGTCVVQFTVMEDGSLNNVKLVRDVGAGCGVEAVRLVRLTAEEGNRWLAGKQRGIPVQVQYVLPIKFELDVERTSSEELPPPDPGEEVMGENQPVYIPDDAFNMEEEITMEDIGPRPEAEPVREGRTARVDAPPPPPPPPPPAEVEIFKVVEDMPRFKSEECEAKDNLQKRKNCAQTAMLEYIYQHITYPADARTNSIEGMVVITFVINKQGWVEDARIVREIGGGCGEEALRVVNTMNDNGPSWVPGKQRGRAVNVQYNIPVKYKL